MTNAFEGHIELPVGSDPAPGVVLLQEWWGVNDQLKAIAKDWAAEGFLVAVPDLYHGRVIPIGESEAASAAMKALDFPAAVAQIAEAVAMLQADPRCSGSIAVTGYCMGGALAFATAVEVRGLASVVPFYGLPGELDWSKVDAPIQAHFAQHDNWATVIGAQKIKDAVTVPMELHVYDAQHAFCNDQRPEVYNADAARQSWGRAVAFVRAHAK
ncbi:MAG TPA: dienelactone hydrolase family protein [Kofleriaceae bacterium]|nr:dienelactone hydrolase family protein [Kofleriaceae bacterium]